MVAVVSIGVGMGANLALLGWGWGLAYQERDTPGADRLLWISGVEPSETGPAVLPLPTEAIGLLSGGAAWDAVGAWDGSLTRVEGAGAGKREWVRWTTPGFMKGEGVPASTGRLLLPEDTLPGAEAVALVSQARALTWWGSAQAALGRTIRVNGQARRIVGVIGPAWQAGEYAVHIPLAGSMARGGRKRVSLWVHLPNRSRLVRQRADVEIRARLAALRTDDGTSVGVRTGSEKEVLRTGSPFGFGAFLLPLAVLLLACVNVATVLLARGAAVAPVLATRRMLGASSWDLVRPLLIECGLLAGLAGALALALTAVTFRTALAMPGPDAPHLGVPTLIGAAALMAVVIGGAGVWPAYAAIRIRAAELLRSSHVVAGGRAHRLRSVLFTVEAALATALVLVASEAAGRALSEAHRGVGYDPEGVVHADVDFASLDGGATELSALAGRLGTEPRVAGAGVLALRPLAGQDPLEIDGAPLSSPARIPAKAARVGWLTPGLRTTLGLPLLRGRDLSPDEFATDQPVALVNQAAARLFPSPEHVLGGHLRVRLPDGDMGATLTVVGVTADMRDQPLFQQVAPPVIYTTRATLVSPGGRARVYVRARGPLAGATESLHRALEEILPEAVPDVRSTADEVHAQTRGPRLNAQITSVAGAFALLLAALGLFGITSLVVMQERRSLAVRAALGAGPGRLLVAALSRVLTPLSVGVIAGLALRAVVVPFLIQAGPAVRVDEAYTWLVAALVLGGAFVAAAAPPLRRAAHVAPAETLREV